MDPRYAQLAEIMAGFSTKVQPGEHVLLQTDISTPHDMNRAVIEAVRKRGGVFLSPFGNCPAGVPSPLVVLAAT